MKGWKGSKTVFRSYIEIVSQSNCKSNEVWVYQGREFDNRPIPKWLFNSDVLMYSRHEEEKSLVPEMLTKISKGKIYRKFMIRNFIFVIWINWQINIIILITAILVKHLLILIILLWIKKSESSHKASNFKVGDKLWITKYKDNFSKDYTKNWSKETFLIDSVL